MANAGLAGARALPTGSAPFRLFGDSPVKTTIAFDRCNRNVTRMLWLLLKYEGITVGPGTQFTAADFVKEWNQGGKKFLEQYWRDSANTPTKTAVIKDAELDDDDDTADAERELFQGKHEWIPTNMLGYIVEKGIMKYGEIRWVYLAETLRTPTRAVVVKPAKMIKKDTANPIGLTGHVGALYTATNAPLFKGQATFHNELRTLLKTYLSDTVNNLDGYKNALLDHIRDWYWQGDPTDLSPLNLGKPNLSQVACPYRYNSGQAEYTSWGPTLADMASALRKEWENQNVFLQNIFTSSLSMKREQKLAGEYFDPRPDS